MRYRDVKDGFTVRFVQPNYLPFSVLGLQVRQSHHIFGNIFNTFRDACKTVVNLDSVVIKFSIIFIRRAGKSCTIKIQNTSKNKSNLLDSLHNNIFRRNSKTSLVNKSSRTQSRFGARYTPVVMRGGVEEERVVKVYRVLDYLGGV